MATQGRSLQSYGRTVNAAAGSVTVDKQRNEIDQGTNIVIKRQVQYIRNTILEPRLAPVDPAAAFIGLRRPRLEPVQDDDIIWDDRLRSHVHAPESGELTDKLISLWEETQDTVDELTQIVRDFHAEIPDDGSDHDDVNDILNSSWGKSRRCVFKELAQAKKSYKNGYAKSFGVSSILLVLENNLPYYFDWVNLLPGDDRRVCLSEPFRCLLSAMTDSKKIDTVIFKSLGEIPEMFGNAKGYMTLYKSRRLTTSLHEKSIDLFRILAKLLKKLLKYVESGEKLIKQPTKDIDQLIERLRSSLVEMNMESSTANQVCKTKDMTLTTEREPKLHLYKAFTVFLNSGNEKALLVPMEYSQQDMGPAPKRLRMSTDTEVETTENKLHPIALANHLSYDKNQVESDIKSLVSPVDIKREHMIQLSSLTKHNKFKRWLKDENNATALLIHGNFDDIDEISPLSYLCARFPTHYVRNDQAIFLHYFCSIQSPRHRHLESASNIMSSLTGQLLTHPRLSFYFDLRFLSNTSIKKIRKQNFEETCRLFLNLVDQLRKYKIVLFCVIDSVSIYETKKLQKDIERLFSSLRELINSQRGRRRKKGTNMLFKLLVTETTSTRYTWKYFQSSQILDMAETDDDVDEEDLDLG